MPRRARRALLPIGIGLGLGVFAAGFLAYFVSAREDGYRVDGLGRVLVASPALARVLLGADREWAGGQWFLLDVLWFFGGLSLAVKLSSLASASAAQDQTAGAPPMPRPRVRAWAAIIIALASACGTVQALRSGVRAARRAGLGVTPRVLRVRSLDDYCQLLAAEADKSSVVFPEYELDPLRDSVVSAYRGAILAPVTRAAFGKELPETDHVVAELVRLRMIGAWRDGTHLHLADELGAGWGDQKESALALWQEALKQELHPPTGDNQDASARCFYGAVNDLFVDLTLHGPGSGTATISLDGAVEAEARIHPSGNQ